MAEYYPLKGAVPKYAFVKEEVARKILSGEWKNNSLIPSEERLCEIFNVSRSTIRKAIDELEKEQYLTKVQGKGTFVKRGQIEQRLSKFYSFSDELRNKGMSEYARIIEFDVILADRELADHLCIIPDAKVFKITRVRNVEMGPYALETSYIPQNVVPELSEAVIEQLGLYQGMKKYGVIVETAVESFTAVNLNEYQSQLLEVELHDAAIALTRTTYSGVQVVEYCESYIRGDFFSYSVTLT